MLYSNYANAKDFVSLNLLASPLLIHLLGLATPLNNIYLHIISSLIA